MKKILFSKSNNLLIQIIRYFFVGGTAFVIDFGVLYLLTNFLNFHYLVSAAISFTLGLIANYILSVMWVFSSRNIKNRWIEFLIFSLIGLCGLLLNELIMWFSTDLLKFHYLISKIISTIIIFSWNFCIRKFILFRNKAKNTDVNNEA